MSPSSQFRRGAERFALSGHPTEQAAPLVHASVVTQQHRRQIHPTGYERTARRPDVQRRDVPCRMSSSCTESRETCLSGKAASMTRVLVMILSEIDSGAVVTGAAKTMLMHPD